MPQPFAIVSCAKINLSLDIVGLRADGYHELRSVVHTLALHDTLSFEFGGGGWRLSCDDPELETPGNLCLKAARAWAELARANGLSGPLGGDISLRKRIPHGAGLGGGSGNAWAVLEALSRAYDPEGKRIPRPELQALAKTVGADVPLFARGGALLLEGIGERLEPLPSLLGWAVLAQPSARVSTPQAFRSWDATQEPSGAMTPALLQAWRGIGAPENPQAQQERLSLVAGRLGNDLRRAARALGVPVEAGIESLRQAGALGAEMTGSGSAVFGLCRDEGHARQVQAAASESLNARQPGEWQLWRAPRCNYGARLELETASSTSSTCEGTMSLNAVEGEDGK